MHKNIFAVADEDSVERPLYIKKEKDSLEEYAAARNSFNRFASSWSNKPAYKGVPVHGFNVWEGNPKCHTSRKSSCSGADWSQGCGYMKFMTAEAAKEFGLIDEVVENRT